MVVADTSLSDDLTLVIWNHRLPLYWSSIRFQGMILSVTVFSFLFDYCAASKHEPQSSVRLVLWLLNRSDLCYGVGVSVVSVFMSIWCCWVECQCYGITSSAWRSSCCHMMVLWHWCTDITLLWHHSIVSLLLH